MSNVRFRSFRFGDRCVDYTPLDLGISGPESHGRPTEGLVPDPVGLRITGGVVSTDTDLVVGPSEGTGIGVRT